MRNTENKAPCYVIFSTPRKIYRRNKYNFRENVDFWVVNHLVRTITTVLQADINVAIHN